MHNIGSNREQIIIPYLVCASSDGNYTHGLRVSYPIGEGTYGHEFSPAGRMRPRNISRGYLSGYPKHEGDTKLDDLRLVN